MLDRLLMCRILFYCSLKWAVWFVVRCNQTLTTPLNFLLGFCPVDGLLDVWSHWLIRHLLICLQAKSFIYVIFIQAFLSLCSLTRCTHFVPQHPKSKHIDARLTIVRSETNQDSTDTDCGVSYQDKNCPIICSVCYANGSLVFCSIAYF